MAGVTLQSEHIFLPLNFQLRGGSFLDIRTQRLHRSSSDRTLRAKSLLSFSRKTCGAAPIGTVYASAVPAHRVTNFKSGHYRTVQRVLPP
jgi:hypothetical protein